MEEFDEDFDILEFFQSKGSVLDPFKNEYLDLQKNCEFLAASNVGKERDVDYQAGELRTLRDQLNFTRRNIDELISQQEVLKLTIDTLNHKKENLAEHENESREEIGVYSGYFNDLKEALSVGADWSSEQLEQRSILEKERDFISSKLENKLNMLNGQRIDIDRTFNRIQQLEAENQQLDDKMRNIDKRRTELKKESATLVGKKEALEKNIFDCRETTVKFENELADRSRMHQVEDRALKVLDSNIQKSKNQMEVYISEYDQLYRNLQDLTAELDRENNSNVRIQEDIAEKEKYIEQVKLEIKATEKETAKINQLREMASQKCIEVEESRHAAEMRMDELNKQITNVRETETTAVRKEIDALEKQIATLKAEMDVLRKKYVGSDRTSKAMTDLIALNHNGKVNLSLEIKVLQEEVEQHKTQIRQLLIEKERFEHNAEMANQQYYTALEELKLQELQIQELNKKIILDQTKLKQKQSLYESVRSDRNLYSKQLMDSQEEITTLKRKFRSMNHHIDQMKEEISSKDNAIVKEHFLHHSVDKERELLKNELTKIKKQVQSSESIIENQRTEIMKLNRIIEEADLESQRQRNELSSILSERNLLTSQLVKRNGELNEMYEKIKVQRSNLRIGERNYARYLEEISKWQQMLRDTVHAQNDNVLNLAKLDHLQHHLIQLDRDLLKEKTRSRALLNELDTPMNVHRWRILESSDPKKFEKITQIHNLQRQLVTMSDNVIQNDLLIQEKERIYVELKNVISRQPGPEVEEQILVYQQTLKDKTKQLSAMNQELDMYIEQVARFKEEIGELDGEIGKMSKRWIKINKKSIK